MPLVFAEGFNFSMPLGVQILGAVTIFHRQITTQFDRLQTDLEKLLRPEDAESFMGKLRSAFATTTKETTKELSESIISEMKSVRESVQALTAAMALKSAVDRERAKGTLKGTDFELDHVLPFLETFALHRRDNVEHTGRKAGSNGPKAFAGDFVYTIDPRLGGLGLKLAIEAKNSKDSLSTVIKQTREAKDNRDASVAIGISTNPSLLPADESPIKFIDDSTMIVCLRDYEETGFLDATALEVALDVARFMALTSRKGATIQLDALAANRHIGNIQERLKAIVEVKKRVTSIVTTAGDVTTLLSAIQSDIITELSALREQLGLDGGTSSEARKSA